MKSKKHVVILSGAGVSAESGLKTFRDNDGLWMGHNVQDVATPEAYARNPQLVQDFYNERRKDVAAAEPNAAHLAIAALEEDYDCTVITQNIDDLHERAGSTKVVHLHGEIFKMHSPCAPEAAIEIRKDINEGDRCKLGGQYRPHIVWFGEAVPMIETAVQIVQDCDMLVVVGTSLQVYPAASLLHYAPAFLPVVVIDKKIPDLPSRKNIHIIEKPATKGVRELATYLKKYFE